MILWVAESNVGYQGEAISHILAMRTSLFK